MDSRRTPSGMKLGVGDVPVVLLLARLHPRVACGELGRGVQRGLVAFLYGPVVQPAKVGVHIHDGRESAVNRPAAHEPVVALLEYHLPAVRELDRHGLRAARQGAPSCAAGTSAPSHHRPSFFLFANAYAPRSSASDGFSDTGTFTPPNDANLMPVPSDLESCAFGVSDDAPNTSPAARFTASATFERSDGDAPATPTDMPAPSFTSLSAKCARSADGLLPNPTDALLLELPLPPKSQSPFTLALK